MSPLIRKMERLFALTAEEKQVLERACSKVVEVDADQDIIIDGDQPLACNVLLEGVVCRYKILRSGKRQILSFQFPGDIFDAQSFILERMDHSIATLMPCTVALIPHETMRNITENYPRIARAIWKDTLVDAAVFREWMISIGRRDAYARIAHLMCEVFTRLEAVGLADAGRIDWPITQAEIGDALGLSLVHVNRTLQALRAKGFITLKDHKLVIHDWAGLKRAGDFEAEYLHLRQADGEARWSDSSGLRPGVGP